MPIFATGDSWVQVEVLKVVAAGNTLTNGQLEDILEESNEALTGAPLATAVTSLALDQRYYRMFLRHNPTFNASSAMPTHHESTRQSYGRQFVLLFNRVKHAVGCMASLLSSITAAQSAVDGAIDAKESAYGIATAAAEVEKLDAGLGRLRRYRSERMVEIATLETSIATLESASGISSGIPILSAIVASY